MTNEMIRTEAAKTNGEQTTPTAEQRKPGALVLNRSKVADSARLVGSRTGYGMLISD